MSKTASGKADTITDLGAKYESQKLEIARLNAEVKSWQERASGWEIKAWQSNERHKQEREMFLRVLSRLTTDNIGADASEESITIKQRWTYAGKP